MSSLDAILGQPAAEVYEVKPSMTDARMHPKFRDIVVKETDFFIYFFHYSPCTDRWYLYKMFNELV